MRAYAMAQCLPSVWHKLFPLNEFFSRTTRPISIKLAIGRKHALGFRFVQIKGLAPFGTNKGQNKENFDKSSKIFFSCSNKVSGVKNGHSLKGQSFI